jgi:hypothetical protein
MPNRSAIEILIFRPFHEIPPNERGEEPLRPMERGVHENLMIKQRFEHYVSIGVFLENSQLKYYLFDEVDNNPITYNSLAELQANLDLEAFKHEPKLFIMGHGDDGGVYGLANIHGPSERIIDRNFDKLITDFVGALPNKNQQISVTLEACNTDNQQMARVNNQPATFLARLSAEYPSITFGGTGPWDPENIQTGFRASGGSPTLNAPITSMGGGIWKHGNSVIFHHDDQQMAVRKSMFATTETAKAVKINTVEYAHEMLQATTLNKAEKAELLKAICLNRDVLRIEDLNKVSNFPKVGIDAQAVAPLLDRENQILEVEKIRYISRVQSILDRADAGMKLTEKEVLTLTLGIKDFSIFNKYEDLRDWLFAHEDLLQLVMVSCGKVLVAGPDNDGIIDELLSRGVDINSVDENRMTALHYAVQNFFNYREEPLHLIKKLLDCGANLEARDTHDRTPLMLAAEHSRDERVIASQELLALLEERRRLNAVPVIKNLFDSSANLEVPELQKRRRSPLELAAEQRESSVVPPDETASLKLARNKSQQFRGALEAVRDNEAAAKEDDAEDGLQPPSPF